MLLTSSVKAAFQPCTANYSTDSHDSNKKQTVATVQPYNAIGGIQNELI